MKKRSICCTVLAAAALMLGSAFTVSAAEWTQVGSEWVYLDSNGEYMRDVWKSDASGKQYYLGSDGFMVRSTLLDYNGSYYYVNSAGEMVVNEWRYLPNASWQGGSPDESNWYYFGPSGRAFVTSNGTVQLQTIGDKKYAFDVYGRMLTGWVSEGGEELPAEEWQNAMYYGDAGGAGNIVTDSWVLINVPDEDNEANPEPMYHFFFGSNGKKAANTDKTIGDKKYHFDERGVATYGWLQTDGSWAYYGDLEDPYLHTGWFQAVPDEDLNADANAVGTEYWYYASSRGDIAMSEFKTVGSSTYAFNERGEMISGLKVITLAAANSKSIDSISNVETLDDLPTGDTDTTNVYYFTEGNGAVKTGSQTVTIDGTAYTFNFKSNGTPKGGGTTGISDNHIYDHGRRLQADDGTKYQVVAYGDKEYLLNETGSIQKKKKNVKDADGYYYCSSSDGTLLHGPLDDKCEEKH